MTRLGRRASLLVAFLLLTSVATAYAECAWVLWHEVNFISGGVVGWTVVQAVTSKSDCDAIVERTMKDARGADDLHTETSCSTTSSKAPRPVRPCEPLPASFTSRRHWLRSSPRISGGGITHFADPSTISPQHLRSFVAPARRSGASRAADRSPRRARSTPPGSATFLTVSSDRMWGAF